MFFATTTSKYPNEALLTAFLKVRLQDSQMYAGAAFLMHVVPALSYYLYKIRDISLKYWIIKLHDRIETKGCVSYIYHQLLLFRK